MQVTAHSSRMLSRDSTGVGTGITRGSRDRNRDRCARYAARVASGRGLVLDRKTFVNLSRCDS